MSETRESMYDSLPSASRYHFNSCAGPVPLPFIGNLHKVLGEGIHKVWPKWNKLYGPVYQVWWGATPAAIVTDCQAARYWSLLLLPASHAMLGLAQPGWSCRCHTPLPCCAGSSC